MSARRRIAVDEGHAPSTVFAAIIFGLAALLVIAIVVGAFRAAS